MVSDIAAGVDLASESIQHHKEKKAAKKAEAAQREQSLAQLPPAYEEHEHKVLSTQDVRRKAQSNKENVRLKKAMRNNGI